MLVAVSVCLSPKHRTAVPILILLLEASCTFDTVMARDVHVQ
jgi:hypothetical protein